MSQIKTETQFYKDFIQLERKRAKAKADEAFYAALEEDKLTAAAHAQLRSAEASKQMVEVGKEADEARTTALKGYESWNALIASLFALYGKLMRAINAADPVGSIASSLYNFVAPFVKKWGHHRFYKEPDITLPHLILSTTCKEGKLEYGAFEDLVREDGEPVFPEKDSYGPKTPEQELLLNQTKKKLNELYEESLEKWLDSHGYTQVNGVYVKKEDSKTPLNQATFDLLKNDLADHLTADLGVSISPSP